MAKVLGTTVRLWLQRRSARARSLLILAVVVVVFAAGALTVMLARHPGAAPTAGRHAGRAHQSAPSLAAIAAAAAARSAAADWVVGQVSHGAIVACDPEMCSALEARGFPAGDIMMLGPAAHDVLGSAVVVATSAVRSLIGPRLQTVYAPGVLASFGSGAARVDVLVYAPGGAAAYQSAFRADLRSRQHTGHQLLGNSNISAPPAVRRQLAAGQADSRLLSTIATLSDQYRLRIVALSDSGPGAGPGIPLRAAELASPPGAKNGGRGYLQSMLSFALAQLPPFRADAKLLKLAGGQQVLSIEFAAPSPLGLLG